MVRFEVLRPWSSTDAVFEAIEAAMNAAEIDKPRVLITRGGKTGPVLTLSRARTSVRNKGEPGRIRIALGGLAEDGHALFEIDASPHRGIEFAGRSDGTRDGTKRIQRAFDEAVAAYDAAAARVATVADLRDPEAVADRAAATEGPDDQHRLAPTAGELERPADPARQPNGGAHATLIATIAAAVFGALALLGGTLDAHGALLIGLGLAVTVAILRLHQRAGRRDPALAVSGVAALAFVALLLVLGGDSSDKSAGEPASGRTVTVHNRVTDGARRMREDTPLKLFYSPQLCRSEDCIVPETGFHTGNKISEVVCQVAGDRITNGDDADDSDDNNPNLFESRLWYGIRTSTGRLAYFSEVWADPQQRGGLGLPDCSSASIDRP